MPTIRKFSADDWPALQTMARRSFTAPQVSPVEYAYADLETVLEKAREFTEVTHNHPEGIKGGQATAVAIFLARTWKSKDNIKSKCPEWRSCLKST
ncbi:ADP-ribosylglycohydrolase family protein [Desulfonatronum sp. SC1]|uniref:ADP-ribosylglycohydrolase family protein n=1 Tax=Desulfonatronum sp. SC1 TaxID=2109626 RepID=UPI000D3088C9|nr:ADP-ribosylglycohydrolase family protein [Desulfonatronum sp. SC1]PTN38446.1 hypothetical protein C6366_02510 [Desulfonatronum sp. SC1]